MTVRPSGAPGRARRTGAVALVLERLEDRCLPDAGLGSSVTDLLARADVVQGAASQTAATQPVAFGSAGAVNQYLVQQGLQHYDLWIGQPPNDWFAPPSATAVRAGVLAA